MKVLVTGASGFVGSHLVRMLVEKGDDVRVLVRKTSNLFLINDLDLEKVYGDITDFESVKEAVKGVEQVYHVAALYDMWAEDPRIFYKINVNGTLNVMKAALNEGVKKIVYTSTVGAVGVVDNPNDLCDESCVWNLGFTGDNYMISKYEAEHEVLNLFCREKLPVTIVNPSAPIGPADWKPTPTGQLIVQFLKRKIPAYSDAGLNFVDVRDVAKAHILAMEKGKLGERYIISNENTTMKDVLILMGEITGLKPPKLKTPYWANYFTGALLETLSGITKKSPLLTKSYVKVSNSYMRYDNGKSIKELGITYRNIRESFEDAIKWYRENGYI